LTAFPGELLRRCWFLAGPTASGKTELGIALARRLNAEVVALDSMTVYRGLDIGTAKPPVSERGGIPHHLFDILDPCDEYNVAEYLNAARVACEGIVSRGCVPLFVGGTGLYLRSLLRGLFDGPAADAELRARLDQELVADGELALHARLARVDPVLAGRLHPRDTRRVIRGLEVWELTGQTLSGQQTQAAPRAEDRPSHVYWLDTPRDWLHDRIETRARRMFADGIVDETRVVLDTNGFGKTASQALGYAEVLEHLAGRCSLEEAVVNTIAHTRQFAKRQCTWFRNMAECSAIAVGPETRPDEIAERLANSTERSA
jgi:tRNA dimethylallyltransferase